MPDGILDMAKDHGIKYHTVKNEELLALSGTVYSRLYNEIGRAS